ncbi:hypothetical protein ScPMuIL_014903 [Solemya velum]
MSIFADYSLDHLKVKLDKDVVNQKQEYPHIDSGVVDVSRNQLLFREKGSLFVGIRALQRTEIRRKLEAIAKFDIFNVLQGTPLLQENESGNLISKKKLKRVPKTSNRLGVFLKLKCNEQAIYGLNEQDSPGNETEYDDDTQKDTLVERFRFMQESAPSQEESGNLISKKKLKRVPKTSNRLGVFLKLKCNEQAIYGLNEQDSPGNETEYDDDTQKDTLVERFRFMQESAPTSGPLDTSHIAEQFALCIRPVDEKLDICGEFLQFAKLKRTSRHFITENISHINQVLDISLENMRGQGYDGPAAMSSDRAGIQNRL